MSQYDEKILKAKCMQLLQQFDNILKFIVDEEMEKLSSPSLIGENEFDTLKKLFTLEGKKEGLRTILQKINEHASKNI